MLLQQNPESRIQNPESRIQIERDWRGYYKNVADHLLAGARLIITPEWAKATIQCIEGCEIAARENRVMEVTFDF